MGPYQKACIAEVEEFVNKEEQEGCVATIHHRDFVRMSGRAYLKALTRSNTISGFEASGSFPVDLQKLRPHCKVAEMYKRTPEERGLVSRATIENEEREVIKEWGDPTVIDEPTLLPSKKRPREEDDLLVSVKATASSGMGYFVADAVARCCS